jgi:dipeptidyl aminopeptidase/acylaminoacyl peptidase
METKSPVNVVTFSRDGQFIAAGTDREAVVLNMATREQVVLTEGHEGNVKALSFSPDSSVLAIGGLSSDVILWDLRNMESRRLSEHKKSLRALTFSPNGNILASASEDGDILLWDVESGVPFGKPLPGSHITISGLAFDFSGDRLAATGPRSELVVWDVGIDSLRRRACEVAGRNLEPHREWERFLRDEPYQVTCGQALLAEANRHVTLAQHDEAETRYREVVTFAGKSRDYNLANLICWFGTLNEFEKLVMPACDQAVDLAPPVAIGNCYDSRGVARAVSGDIPGAIGDFEKFVAWAGDRESFKSAREQRSMWIEALKGGTVPFDKETLRQLKKE